MVRLESKRLSELEQHLNEWQTPAAMSNRVDCLMDEIGSKDFFNQAGLSFLRDAWIAAKFGKLRIADEVRLVEDVWPDFEIKLEDQIEKFEAVEAYDPKRRRGDEYREDLGEVEFDSPSDWKAQAKQAHAWLEIACKKKVSKNYAPGANLVIYLNLEEYGMHQRDVEASFVASTSFARGFFVSIWILWKDKIYQI